MLWRAIKRSAWNLAVAGAAFVPVVAIFALFYWPQASEGGFEVRDLIGDFIFFGPYALAFWWIIFASAVVAAISRVTGLTVTRRLLLAVLGGSSAVVFISEILWRWANDWLANPLADGGPVRLVTALVLGGLSVGLVSGGFTRIGAAPLLWIGAQNRDG